jgi:membrane protein YqaA with SNARE-associated domain
MNRKYLIFNYSLLAFYVIILILFWFFSDQLKSHTAGLILQYGLWAILILSLLIEILPSAISPPSLLLVCKTIGLSTPWSVTFMTVGSLIGGLISFQIGRKAGTRVVSMFVRGKDITKLQETFNKYGSYALMIISISPIPDYPIFFGSLGMTWKKYFIYGFFFRAAAFALMGYLFATAGKFIF